MVVQKKILIFSIAVYIGSIVYCFTNKQDVFPISRFAMYSNSSELPVAFGIRYCETFKLNECTSDGFSLPILGSSGTQMYLMKLISVGDYKNVSLLLNEINQANSVRQNKGAVFLKWNINYGKGPSDEVFRTIKHVQLSTL